MTEQMMECLLAKTCYAGKGSLSPQGGNDRNEGLVKRDDSLPRSNRGCLERKEPISVEKESVAVHEEVPKELLEH
jgi:hypothetical protein